MATRTDPSKPVAKDDLQKLPLAEVEKRLGSSPDGLTEAEAKKRLAQYGPNEIRGKEDQRAAQIPRLFLGPDSLDDRSRGGALRRRSPLARLLHHSRAAARQRDHRLLGRTRGRQRDRRPEGAARDQGAGQARRKVDHAAREGAGARRRDSSAPGRHRSRRCASAGRRRSLGGSVGADGQNRCRRHGNPATRFSPVRSSVAARSTRWSMRPAARPISARRRNWSRRRSPSAISRRPC